MDPQQESYHCEQCDKVFGRKHHLKRHALTHSRPQLHLTCDQCGTALTQKCYDRGHSGSKEFRCQFCPRSYTRRYAIVANLRAIAIVCCSHSYSLERHRLAAHLRKHHPGREIKREPLDQASPSSPQDIQDLGSSTSPNTRASPFQIDGVSTNQPERMVLAAADHNAQDQTDVSHDVMVISDDSENEENNPPPQVIPPATSHTSNLGVAVSASGPRSRASGPTAPSAPATNSSRPARQTKSSLPKLRRVDERFLLPSHRYDIRINTSIYEALKSYLVNLGHTEDATFPWWKVINDFVHLYFEHFDHDFPVVHPYSLECGLDKFSWMVLLAVITVGSQYSAFGNASKFSEQFGEILSEAITQNVSPSLGEHSYHA